MENISGLILHETRPVSLIGPMTHCEGCNPTKSSDIGNINKHLWRSDCLWTNGRQWQYFQHRPSSSLYITVSHTLLRNIALSPCIPQLSNRWLWAWKCVSTIDGLPYCRCLTKIRYIILSHSFLRFIPLFSHKFRVSISWSSFNFMLINSIFMHHFVWYGK